MFVNKLKKLTRWLSWSVLWFYFNPEFLSVETWVDFDVAKIIKLMLQYISIGMLLEYLYRKLNFSFVERKIVDIPKTDAPNCTGNPWISLKEQLPPEHSLIEFLCVDGAVRNARTHGRVDSRLKFEIQYEPAILKQQQAHPQDFCPTHWRRHVDVVNKYEGYDDVF